MEANILDALTRSPKTIGGIMGNHALNGVEGFIKRSPDGFRFDPKHLVVEEGFNGRQVYGDQEDLELKENIRQNGVLESLKVQKNDDNQLVIRNGHRRHWCCISLIEEGVEIPSVPIELVDKKMGPAELIFLMLNSNTGKKFNPLEEADVFRRLKALGFEVKQIAQRIGKSVPFVYNRLNLINSSAETREAIKKKEIGVTVASKAIASAGGDPDKQKRAIRKIVQRKNQARIQWSKKIGGLFFEGFEEKQKPLVDLFLSKDFSSKLDEMGFDPETLKITISKKGEPN